MNFYTAMKKARQAAKARQTEILIIQDTTAGRPANDAYYFVEADDPEAAQFHYAAPIIAVIDADGHPAA